MSGLVYQRTESPCAAKTATEPPAGATATASAEPDSSRTKSPAESGFLYTPPPHATYRPDSADRSCFASGNPTPLAALN